MACEKCWADAYIRMLERGGSQVDCYRELIEERKDNPCTPEEERGDAGHRYILGHRFYPSEK